MVHKKYTYKDGKRYGPYLYENKRVGEKIITTYVGKQGDDRLIEGFVFIIALGMIALSFFLYNLSPTGHAVLEVSDNYNYGDNLDGTLKLSLKNGEFIPADTLVIIKNGETETTIPLSSLLSEEQTSGSFYVDNINIVGNGTGYGVIGKKEIYPNINFELLVSSYSNDESQNTEVEQNNSIDEQNNENSEVIEDIEENTASVEPQEIVSDEVPQEIPQEEPVESEQTNTAEEQTDVVEESTATEEQETSATSTTETSPTESSSIESNPLTGAVINEEFTVSGTVSKDEEFRYSLDGEESLSIVEDSVFVGEEKLSVEVLDLTIDEEEAVVTTDYEIVEEGFGAEFLGDESENIYNIDLSDFGINITNETIQIILDYAGTEIVSLTKDISLIGEEIESEENATVFEVNNSLNETQPLINQTVLNETIVNETIIDVVNSTISQIKDIPTIRLARNSSVLINLSDYFVGAEEYEINITDIQSLMNGSMLNLSVENFSGARQGRIIAVSGNESLLSNVFNVLVSSRTATVTTSRDKIVVGEPVRWTKNISLDVAENVTIELPAEAQNISVLKIDSNVEPAIVEMSGITGNVVNANTDNTEFSLIDFIKGLFSSITGRVVDTQDIGNETIEIILADNATNYLVEYYTDAPQISEVNLENGKQVTVSASDELNYSDVLAFTYLPFNLTNDEISGLRIIWYQENVEETIEIKNVSDVENVSTVSEVIISADENESEIITSLLTGNVVAETNTTNITNINLTESNSYILREMPFDYYDLDGDGLNEYVEWIVPHLSNQTFNITFLRTVDSNLTYLNITTYNNYSVLNITNNPPYADIVAYWPFDTYYNSTAFPDFVDFDDFPKRDGDDFLVPSAFGNAYYLNGTNSLNVTYNSRLTPSELGVSFWFYPSEIDITASFRGIIKSAGATGNQEGWRCGIQQNTFYCNVSNQSGDSIGGIANGIAANTWNHVFIVYSSVADTFNMYVNGVSVASGTQTGAINYPSSLDLTIGTCPGCNNFVGLVDEVMIFDINLLFPEINNIYSNSSARFYQKGVVTSPPIRINEGNVVDTVFNVSLDDYVIYNGANISVKLDSWDLTKGYNNSDPNLVAYYHADGNTLDSTGNGHNGAFNGDGNASGTRGYLNTSAFNFDGSDDMLNLTHSTLFETSSGTISTWVYIKGLPDGGQHGILNVIPDGGAGQVAYGLRILPNGAVRLRNDASEFDSSSVIKNNTWHHLVGTFNDATNARAIYVDGKLIATTSIAFAMSFSGSLPTVTTVGGRFNGASPDHDLNGSIDELMIFNRTLSATEINNLYFRGKANWNLSQEQNITENKNTYAYNKSSRVLGCWIESGSDSCGSGSDGTLNGNAAYSSSGINIRGNVLNLDGVGDYVTLPINQYTEPTVNNVSFAFWMKPITLEGVSLSTSHSSRGYFLGFSMGTVQCSISNRFCFTVANGTNYQVTSVSNSLFNMREWQHVVGTYNGTAMVLYLNGFEVARNSSVSGNLAYDTNVPPCIGAEAQTAGCVPTYFNGSIDDVAIWNKSLTAEEVRQIYLNSKDKHSNNQFFVSSQATHILPVYSLISGANQFTTPSFYTSTVYPSIISSAGKWICEGKCLIFQNKSGHNVSAFDGFGNLALRNAVTQRDGSINPGPALGSGINAGFGVKDSSGADILLLKPNSGLDIYGTVFQNQGVECTPTARSFVIRNSSGNCVAYVNSTGHIWLKGRLIENVDL